MTTTRPRPFHLVDGMILTSAVALGLGSARWWYHQPGFVNPRDLNVQAVSEMVGWTLLPLAPALIGVRLREPRPSRRRLARQPGLQANLVVCLVAGSLLAGSKWGYRPGWGGLPYAIGNDLPASAGPTLAIAWTLTALVGRRRPEPCAIDRLGRASGWAWIGLWVVRCVLDGNSLIAMWFGP